MSKTSVFILLMSAMAFSCAHGQGSTARKSRRVLSDSRIAKKGSARSRGVQVIQIRRIQEMGDPNLGRSLQKVTPIIQTRP